jgi:hypothetical protein
MQEPDTQTLFNNVKKKRGETFARLLYTEQILDVPNILHILEFSGNNPNEIKTLAKIIRSRYKNKDEPVYHTDKKPLELLNEAGYDAFVVKNLEQQNSITKYFRPGEELCTFRDKDRYKNYYIIHAIKRGAENIQPAVHPQREDEYGTSVISIQIAKEGGFISIKNRYNHHVNNPDATFNNNPDNIIHGLSESLKKYFNVDFNVSEQEFPDNFQMVDDQMVRYNYESGNVYIGSDYYFSGNSITKINKDYEIIIDCSVLDTKTGKFYDIAPYTEGNLSVLEEALKDKKLSIKKNPDNPQERMIFANDVHYATVDNGVITELYLPDTTRIDSSFLAKNRGLRKLYAPKLESVGYNFLVNNTDLVELDLPSLKTVGDEFLGSNYNLKKFNAPKLEKVGYSFMRQNVGLTKLNLPSLKTVGDCFLGFNHDLKKFDAPNLEEIGKDFLEYNESLKELHLPSLCVCSNGFLSLNENLEILDLPNLTHANTNFLSRNIGIQELNMPKLTVAKDYFLNNNKTLKKFNAPKLEKVGDDFLGNNTDLIELDLPYLESVGFAFLAQNKKLNKLNVPKLATVLHEFLTNNESLVELDLPSLRSIGDQFLSNNVILQKLNAPKLQTVGCQFLLNNNGLIELDLPSLEEAGFGFLNKNKCLQKFSAMKLLFISLGFLASNTDLQEIKTSNHPATIMPADNYKHLCWVISKNNIKSKTKDESNLIPDIPQRSPTD